MKAIVVGGSGFIGSNIVKLLLDKNYDIKVIDDLSSGHLINIEKYIQSGDVEFVQGDIRDETLMQKEMQR